MAMRPTTQSLPAAAARQVLLKAVKNDNQEVLSHKHAAAAAEQLPEEFAISRTAPAPKSPSVIAEEHTEVSWLELLDAATRLKHILFQTFYVL